MSPKIDTTLVSQATSGNQAAFTRLVNDHYAMVYGLAFSTLKDPAAAADIAQDAFLIAWTKKATLRNPKLFGAWVCRIVRNLALNWLRSQDYRRRLLERYASVRDDAGEEAAAGEANEAALERSTTIWAALERLTPRLREAVVGYYLEECSMRDAARTLEISVNTLNASWGDLKYMSLNARW